MARIRLSPPERTPVHHRGRRRRQFSSLGPGGLSSFAVSPRTHCTAWGSQAMPMLEHDTRPAGLRSQTTQRSVHAAHPAIPACAARSAGAGVAGNPGTLSSAGSAASATRLAAPDAAATEAAATAVAPGSAHQRSRVASHAMARRGGNGVMNFFN